jgi:hypothetical protein
MKPEAIQERVDSVAKRFFAGTKRINAVVFQSEQFWDASGNGSLGMAFVIVRPVLHPAPRYPTSPIDFFGNPRGDSPRSAVLRNNLAQELQRKKQESEFHRWVASLLTD